MKGSAGDKQRLQHILDAIGDIERFTNGIDYESYIENYMLRLALIKLLEIIGEAADQLTGELKHEFSEVEWSVLKSVRNILVHEYFGIDYKIVWKSIKEDVPGLKNKLLKIMDQKFTN